ncbi:FKBP-type peptidyl-prolyl cis-trans isomerase [Eubacterium oxidoreducens]|uniref:peptidylprolyl isomerase n=1 Tax=Eubacterium oxidoreducens TaxID=1732 RepID=A0A1G6BCD1_EUBOX|nr:FKBP-type peptidyl-prolyl cis-trans isomerase [Eubacterium oxidoreducens]SDB18322.1 trigger factor [Eubacterium oxidoreducens]
MKKKYLLLTLIVPFVVTGCSTSESSSVSDVEISDDAIVTEDGAVVLGDYSSLEGTKEITTVTDDDIESEIESTLADEAQYTDVTRAIKTGDYVTLYMTATIDGDELYEFTQEDGGYEVVAGDESFGSEIDDKLIGSKVGDEFSITVTYDDDFDDSDLAGNTVDYQIEIGAVQEEEIPELTDEYVKENFGYDTVDEYKESVRESLEESNEANSVYSLGIDLISQVTEASTIEYYSDELYEEQEELVNSNYESYMELFGASSVEEIYEMFDMTQDDVDQEIMDSVYTIIVVNAIAQVEGIEISEDDFDTEAQALAESWDYESLEDLEADYTEDEIMYYLLKNRVIDLLISNATVTEVEASDDEEE